MCGIIGYITTKEKSRQLTREKFMEEGLYVNALRGFHSTGIMAIKEQMEWDYLKNAVPASRFINGEDWRKRKFDNWCMVGHNRHATMGQINTDNAHPFRQGDILLVHNGTLRSVYDLPFKNKDIDVDSELIAYNLSQVEPDEADEKVLSKLQGAYALVWFDNRDESVNIVRNSERPLHLGVSKDEEILYFMSEGHMLNMLTQRFNDRSARPKAIWQLGIRHHLKYKKGSLVPEVTDVPNFTPLYTPYWSQERMRSRARPNSEPRSIDSGCSRGPKVMINGEYKIPPKPYRQMVKDWYGLRLTGRYYFKPGGFLPWNDGDEQVSPKGMLYGLMFHEDWDAWLPAYVPNVMETQAMNAKKFDQGWTVTPFGINHTTPDGEGGDQGFTVICRPVWYSWTGDTPDTKNLTQCEDADEIEEEAEELVKGPRETYITLASFEVLVSGGCTMCTGPIFMEDCEEITWVGEHENQPLCPSCGDWATTPTGESV